MKYALISDIHSNLEAFTAALDYIIKEKVDKIYCAGDIVGYGPNPVECIDLIIKNNIRSVKGNHECLNKNFEDSFNQEVGYALNWTKREIISKKKEHLSYLINLPETIENENIFVVHGSPFEYLHGYVEKDDIELQDNAYDKCKKRFLIIGHTHKQFIRKIKKGLIINPGSIGQPRDKNWKTSFTILDTKTLKADNIRLNYDVDSTIIKIMQNNIPSDNGQRLLNGD